MTDDATLSTPPAPDAVKRYYLDGNDPSLLAGCTVIIASDYDSLARQVAGLRARVNDVERYYGESQMREIALKARVEALTTQTNNLMNTVSFKQSQIDSLMFEFCPGEMSAEQRAEWARNQAPASQQEVDDIRSALTGDKP